MKLCALGWLSAAARVVLAGCTSADKCTRGEPAAPATATILAGPSSRRALPAAASATRARRRESRQRCLDAANRKDASTHRRRRGNTHDAGSGTSIDCTAKTFDARLPRVLPRAVRERRQPVPRLALRRRLLRHRRRAATDTCDRSAADDVGCMQDLCKGELERTCEEFGYVDDKPASTCPAASTRIRRACPTPTTVAATSAAPARTARRGSTKNGKCEDGGEVRCHRIVCTRNGLPGLRQTHVRDSRRALQERRRLLRVLSEHGRVLRRRRRRLEDRRRDLPAGVQPESVPERHAMQRPRQRRRRGLRALKHRPARAA